MRPIFTSLPELDPERNLVADLVFLGRAKLREQRNEGPEPQVRSAAERPGSASGRGQEHGATARAFINIPRNLQQASLVQIKRSICCQLSLVLARSEINGSFRKPGTKEAQVPNGIEILFHTFVNQLQ